MNEASHSNPRRQLLTETEAAELLHVSVKTLQRWRWEGRGPYFNKLGAAVRYDVAELDRFIADGRRRSTSDTGQRDS